MPTAKKHQLYSFEDFCRVIPEGQKADLIDGWIYMASPDNLRNHRLNVWLSHVAGLYMELSDTGGQTIGHRVALRFDDRNGPEPDFGYIRPERISIVRPTFVDGAADWLVEIVSPDSVDRDYVAKRQQYENAGVSEYWIIDPMVEKVTCFRLGKNGKFKKIRVTRGILECKALPGFWLKVEWLWQDPLPKLLETVQTILAGRP